MTEFLFEILFQFVFEFLADVVGEFGYRWVADVLRAKVTRLLVSLGAGFGFGVWWGDRLSDELTDLPRLYYVSLAVALAAFAAAVYRLRRPGPAAASVVAPPWRWSSSRLAAFGLLNVAVAAGIDLGYSPGPG